MRTNNTQESTNITKMKTTKWILTLMAVTLAGIAFAASGCKSGCCSAEKPAAVQSHAVQYTCAMHPEILQDKPGNCPKCGMALTEKP